MKRLGVITPQIGSRSETFIRRHIEELAPGRTSVVTRRTVGRIAGHWKPEVPIMSLYDPVRWVPQEICGRAGRRLGLLPTAPLDRAERFFRRMGTEVILSQYLNLSIEWLPLMQRLGIPFFAHAHGFDVSCTYRNKTQWQKMKALLDCSGVIVVNRVMKKRLLELGIPEALIYIIPYGVDVPEELQLSPNNHSEIVCIMIGRMVPKKAPLKLLEAFRLASAKVKKLKLHYIGEGPLQGDVKDYVHKHRLDESIWLHGGLDHKEVLQLLRQSDIYIQHSIVDPDSGDEEGVPLAILEAMANGKPVVSTLHAGIPEAVVDGETGFLVEEGDVETMANDIVRLSADTRLRRRMGTAGWERAKERFTWQREVEELRTVMDMS